MDDTFLASFERYINETGGFDADESVFRLYTGACEQLGREPLLDFGTVSGALLAYKAGIKS